MKKNLLVVVVCILCGAVKGQTSTQYTYQGEIVGISSLIIHFKFEDDVMTGFYKSLSDSVIVHFRGNIDSEGNLMFATTQKPYLLFSGKFKERVIKGQSIHSGNATFHTFYACNLRGIYKSVNGDVFNIALSDKGYLRNGSVIVTHMNDDGRISINDSLNNRFYVKGDTLIADNENIAEECRIYTLSVEGNDYGNDFVTEFPETIKEFGTHKLGSFPKLYKLESNLSVSIRQIPYSGYILAKWTVHSPQNKPHKVITNDNTIVEILKAKDKIEVIKQKIDVEDKEEYKKKGVEVPNRYIINAICNDGVKKTITDYYDPLSDYSFFIAYYPELDILVFEEEAGGDGVVDFNDSSDKLVNNQIYVRNPYFDSPSPDGKLLITGYYPGGAAEGISWHIEKWNSNDKRYEFVASLDLGSENYDFTYLNDSSAWFWSDINKVMFKSPDYCSRNYYYEMQIIEN